MAEETATCRLPRAKVLYVRAPRASHGGLLRCVLQRIFRRSVRGKRGTRGSSHRTVVAHMLRAINDSSKAEERRYVTTGAAARWRDGCEACGSEPSKVNDIDHARHAESWHTLLNARRFGPRIIDTKKVCVALYERVARAELDGT